jgi:hypothetical protein
VPQAGGETFDVWIGKQSLSVTVSGAIVTDCTHGRPPQSWPEGIAFADVQVPVQLAGGSKVECATLGPSLLQVDAEAVTVAGSEHDPLGGPQVQVVAHGGPAGGRRAVKPSKEATAGQGGAAASSPIHTSSGPNH